MQRPGVLSKITAPLYHATLVQDIKISCDWADVVDASFKVLCQLVVAPGKASRRLRREISSDKQALSNLESIILDQGDHQARRDLKMNANEILTQLALDPCISFPLETKENVISRQLSTFLENEGGEEDSMHRFHRSLAGRTVALLSSNSETNSAFILNRHDGIVARLTEKLGTADGIFALRILKNLCIHCTLNKDIVKETLLPKVLTEVLNIRTEPPQRESSALGNDEESQNRSAQGQDEENYNITPLRANTEEIQETASWHQYELAKLRHLKQIGRKEHQNAILTLTLGIYNKLISADDFHDVVQKNTQEHVLVAKLKSIVEDNCQATVDSLTIVKLCGLIAVSMMQRNQNTANFRNQEFVKSLSKASKIMCNLDSCLLFVEKPSNPEARMVLFDIEKEALQLVGC
ncbi:hypothetical protein HU200_010708 [Digitaria exilis]|uniref:Uncharacterized protein n=1 Tax=Digitaria exilis TaxID=1010633 RepID=A0A835KNE4_9POAL|nr:hypothetical protein HU200_010708 [Digitaria exilis]